MAVCPPILVAANNYEWVAELIVVGIVLLLSALGKLAQKQAEKRQQEQRERQYGQEPSQAAEEAEEIEPPPAGRPQQPAPAGQQAQPRQLSVEDIALAMRRAERERLTRQRDALRESARQRAAQQRTAQQRVARQRAAQVRIEPAQPTVYRQAAAPVPRRAVQPAGPVAPVRPGAPAPSVRSRHLSPSTVGQGVTQEVARQRQHFQQDAAQRDRRLGGEALGHLAGGLEVEAPAEAAGLGPVGLIRLDDPTELARAILYSEILGPPLSLRRQAALWES